MNNENQDYKDSQDYKNGEAIADSIYNESVVSSAPLFFSYVSRETSLDKDNFQLINGLNNGFKQV